MWRGDEQNRSKEIEAKMREIRSRMKATAEAEELDVRKGRW